MAILCHSLVMQSESRDQRVPIMLTASELRTVDDWRRHQPDLPSRSEAIRRLIEAGLKAADKPIRGPEPEGGSDKPATSDKPAPRKPPAAKAAPSSKLDQIRALREQAAR
jgi:hypothetical protein